MLQNSITSKERILKNKLEQESSETFDNDNVMLETNKVKTDSTVSRKDEIDEFAKSLLNSSFKIKGLNMILKFQN